MHKFYSEAQHRLENVRFCLLRFASLVLFFSSSLSHSRSLFHQVKDMNLGNVTMTTDKVKLLLLKKKTREKKSCCMLELSEIKTLLLTPRMVQCRCVCGVDLPRAASLPSHVEWG